MKFLPLVCCLLFIVTSCKKEKKRICKVYAGEISYEIGIIQKFTSIPTKVTYSYTYTVDGVNYTSKEKNYGIGQSKEELIGKKYLVVYSSNNPTESDLNFDYPIETEEEFQELKVKFASTPPNPDWPKCK